MSAIRKDTSIDNLRGVMVLGIFVYHSISALSYVKSPQWVPLEVQIKLTQCLSRTLGCFFLLSGYFAVKEGITWSISNWGQLYKRRFQSLVVPYLLWNAIYILVFLTGGLFLPVISERVQALGLKSFWGILGAWLGIWTRPADGPLWYVRDTIYLILLTPLIFPLAKKGKGVILLVILPLLFLMPFLFWNTIGVCPLAPYELIAFSLGIYMRVNRVSLHWFRSQPVLAVISIFLCGFYVFGYFTSKPVVWVFDAGLEYLILIPACLWLARFLTYVKDSLVYRYVTQPTFFIFAAHALCASTVVRLLAPHIPESPAMGILLTCLYVIGGCVLIYPMYFILKRFSPKIAQQLVGGRQ